MFSCRDPELEGTPHHGLTFAQMPLAVKNAVSPRRRALRTLCAYLRANAQQHLPQPFPASASALSSSLYALPRPTPGRAAVGFLTRDADRARQLSALLADRNVPCQVAHINLPLLEEQGDPVAALLTKAAAAARLLEGPAILEESWLRCDALKGLPGAYSAAFVAQLGADGISRLVAPFQDPSAESVAVFAFVAAPGSAPVLFQESLRGRIVPPRGFRGHGWDSIFECAEPSLVGTPMHGTTLSDLPSDAPLACFPRQRALDRLVVFLANTFTN